MQLEATWFVPRLPSANSAAYPSGIVGGHRTFPRLVVGRPMNCDSRRLEFLNQVVEIVGRELHVNRSFLRGAGDLDAFFCTSVTAPRRSMANAVTEFLPQVATCYLPTRRECVILSVTSGRKPRGNRRIITMQSGKCDPFKTERGVRGEAGVLLARPQPDPVRARA